MPTASVKAVAVVSLVADGGVGVAAAALTINSTRVGGTNDVG